MRFQTMPPSVILSLRALSQTSLGGFLYLSMIKLPIFKHQELPKYTELRSAASIVLKDQISSSE